METNETYLDGLIAKAKKSWEGVDVESYMKNVRDMKTETIRCRDLMCGDWITDVHGFPMQIVTVGEDYAYATFVGLEGDPWEFDDKDDQPQPIPITHKILEKNGWQRDNEGVWLRHGVDLCIGKWDGRFHFLDIDQIKLHSVHQVQQVLRLAGLTEMANNFKV